MTRPRGPHAWIPTSDRDKAVYADVLARFEQHHREDTLPRSPRGIFYDLRPTGFGNGVSYTKHPDMKIIGTDKHGKSMHRKVNPMEATPQDVQQVMLKLRRAFTLREDWVADTRAPDPIRPDGWQSAEQFADSVLSWAEDFQLLVQVNQPIYLEVQCEAEGLAPRLARIAGEMGVPVYPGGGFDGLKGKIAFGRRAANRDVPTVVLCVSDYDEFGQNIFTAASEDAIAWARHYGAKDGWLTFERIALTEDQATEFGLLDEDSKAEVDGVPVPEMDRILREAIEQYQDASCKASLAELEEAEREAIPEILSRRLAGG